MLTLVETPTFLRCISVIWADDELMEFKIWLAGNALSGDVIPGAQGLRKIRWSRRGMGKRGGVRVVYYNQLADGRIVLLIAYTKAKFDNLPTDFLLALKKEFDDA
jgi:hypothetical protein